MHTVPRINRCEASAQDENCQERAYVQGFSLTKAANLREKRVTWGRANIYKLLAFTLSGMYRQL